MSSLKSLIALSLLVIPACASEGEVDEETCIDGKCDVQEETPDTRCGPVADTSRPGTVITLDMDNQGRVVKQSTRRKVGGDLEESIYRYDERNTLASETYSWFSDDGPLITELNLVLDIDDAGVLRSIDQTSLSGNNTVENFSYVGDRLSTFELVCASCEDSPAETFKVLYSDIDESTHEITVTADDSDDVTVYRYDRTHRASWSAGIRIGDTILPTDMIPHPNDRLISVSTNKNVFTKQLNYEYDEQGYLVGASDDYPLFLVTYACAESESSSDSK